MTNVVAIGAKKLDDETVEAIAELRRVFPLDYRPTFKVGDIVRFRKESEKYTPKHMKGILAIVRSVRDERLAFWSRRSQEDQVVIAWLHFDKQEQTHRVGVTITEADAIELVEAAKE